MERDTLEPIILTNQSRRRRRPRRRLKLGPWVWRASLGAVALGVTGMFLSEAFEPFAMRYHQKQETRELVKELSEAKEQNQSLKRQINMLRSGQGLELEARKLGYIKQGEIPLQITIKAPLKETE